MSQSTKKVLGLVGLIAIGFATFGIGAAAGIGGALGAAGVGAGLATTAFTIGGLAITNFQLLAIGASLLVASQTPSLERTSASVRGMPQSDPNAVGAFVFGTTTVPSNVVYEEMSGADPDRVIHDVFAHAWHRINSYQSMYLSGDNGPELVTFSGEAGIGNWNNLLWWYKADGSQTQSLQDTHITVQMGLNSWPSTAIFKGVAHSCVVWNVDDPGFVNKYSSVPSTIDIVVQGAWLYDPRLDPAYGTGTQDFGSPSTWSFNDGNAALVLLRFLIGEYSDGGDLIWGRGAAEGDIDMASFVAMANIADETLDSKPRFRLGGMWLLDGNFEAFVQQWEQETGGKLSKIGGMYTVWLPNNDLTPITTITEDMFLAGVPVAHTMGGDLSNYYNMARGRFISPADGYKGFPYPDVTEDTAIASEGERMLTQDFSWVQDQSIAERIARIKVRRSRFTRVWSVALDWRGQGPNFKPFTVHNLNCKETNNVNQLVRVIDRRMAFNGVTVLVLQEESTQIYDETPLIGTPLSSEDLVNRPGPYDGYTPRTIQGIALTINVDADGVSDPGEATISGIVGSAADYTTDGFIIWNGQRVIVPRDAGDNYTYIGGGIGTRYALLLFDTGLPGTPRFLANAQLRHTAIVYRDANGDWFYDNGIGSSSFTPISNRDVALGWVSMSGDNIIEGGLFGAPMPLEIAVDYISGDVTFYYIKATNGTAIKNGTGTLTVEAHRISQGIDTLLSTGTIQLYVGSTLVTVANGYAAGSDGYTGVFDSGDINGSVVVTLKDGPAGSPLDTITLVDIADGLAGDNAVYGYIEPSAPIAWVRNSDQTTWVPAASTVNLDAYFVQAGAEVARIAWQITRDADGILTGASITHKDGDLNTGRVTVTEIGESTQSMSVQFAYSFSGDNSTVEETVVTSLAGADGADGVPADIIAGASIRNWEAEPNGFAAYAPYIKVWSDFANNRLHIKPGRISDAGATLTYAIELEVIGTTVTGFTDVGSEAIWTPAGGALDFSTFSIGADTGSWGSNGIKWRESTTAGTTDEVYLTCAALSSDVLIRMKLRLFDQPSGGLSLGNEWIMNLTELDTLNTTAADPPYTQIYFKPTQGVILTWKGALASAPANPQVNWAYYNTTDGISYIWDGDSWETLAQDGADGTAGYNTATLTAYKRAASPPGDNPGTLTYTFATSGWTPANGWSKTIPAGSDPCYAVSATAYGQGATDEVTAGEWSSPSLILQDGADGADGLNVASAFIYQRTTTDSAPTLPSVTATFTFATGNITGLNNGWTDTIPAFTGSNPYLWVSTATASSVNSTDDILSGEWAAAQKMAQNGIDGNPGADGYNTAQLVAYKRSETTPGDNPGNVTYTFATSAWTPGNGWSKTVPAGTNPCWAVSATAYSQSSTDDILSGEWSSPVTVFREGISGSMIAGAAIRDWTTEPATDGGYDPYIHIYADFANNRLYVKPGCYAGGPTTTTFALELEVTGTTVSSFTDVNSEATWSNQGGPLDFSTFSIGTNTGHYGTNGIKWREGVAVSTDDSVYMTLASLNSNVLCRLKIRLWDQPTSGLSLGNEWILPITENDTLNTTAAEPPYTQIYFKPTQGMIMTWKGSLASAPANPQVNWAYYNTTTLQAYIWDGDSWETLAQDGLDGSSSFGAIVNGGFETGTYVGWNDYGPSTTVQTIVSSGQRSGSYALESDGGGGAPGTQIASLTDHYPVSVGDTIFAAAHFARSESSIPSHNLAFGIWWKTAALAPNGFTVLGSASAGTSGYQLLSGEDTAPASTAYYQLELFWQNSGASTTGKWLIDDVSSSLKGATGDPGLNVASVFIYQRTSSNSAPTLPSASSTYTFATGGITGLNNGWSGTIPAASATSKYLWVSHATASNVNATDSIGSGEWSTPQTMAEDGGTGFETLNKDPYFQQINKYWFLNETHTTPLSSSSITVTAVTDAPEGITTLTNATSGRIDFWSERIPCDPTLLYEVQCAVKNSVAGKQHYLLVSFYDGNGVQITGSSTPASDAVGWDSIGSRHYYRYYNVNFPTTWTRVGIRFGAGGEATIPSNAKSMAIGALTNSNTSATGTAHINFMRVRRIDLKPTVLPASFGSGLTGGRGDLLVIPNQSLTSTSDAGEVLLRGTKFTRPDNVSIPLAAYRTVIYGPWGEGRAGHFFLMYTATLPATRFGGTAGDWGNGYFVNVQHQEGIGWRAINNSGTEYTFTPAATDCIIAGGYALASTGGINTIVSMLGSPEQEQRPDQALVFRETFERYIDQDHFFDYWSMMEGSPVTGEVGFSTNGAVGGKALTQDGGIGGRFWVEWSKNLIPFDPNALYKMSVRVRKTTEETTNPSLIYFGISGLAADGVTHVNTAGSDSYSSQHYIVFSGVDLTVAESWVERTVYFYGVAATGQSYSTEGLTPLGPRKLHQNVRFIRPMFILNYDAVTSAIDADYEVDYIEIEKVTENQAALGTLVIDPYFYNAYGQSWITDPESNTAASIGSGQYGGALQLDIPAAAGDTVGARNINRFEVVNGEIIQLKMRVQRNGADMAVQTNGTMQLHVGIRVYDLNGSLLGSHETAFDNRIGTFSDLGEWLPADATWYDKIIEFAISQTPSNARMYAFIFAELESITETGTFGTGNVKFDSISAVRTAGRIVYGGRLSSGGSGTNYLPPGWSASNITTGKIQVTHDLALATGNDLAVSATVVGSTGHYCEVTNLTFDGFEIWTRDNTNALVNIGASFIAQVIQ